MFIEIDYNKRKVESVLHLAKPSKLIIDILNEKFNDKLSIKLGNINQLDFSLPYQIDDGTGNMIPNPHVDTVAEKMLIRLTLGAYQEWYIIDSIEEDADTTDTFNVTAFSLGYELKGKRISEYTETEIDPTSLLNNLLDNTVWKVGEVDALFQQMYRSFDSGTDSNVLDCITNAGTTYGALIVWDTEARTISFKDGTQLGTWKGMTVDYGKFIQNIKRTRTTDEMTTRLWVYGSNDLTISTVNPTGQPYLENFGYFMYPFQRDANKNITSHSNFMSDDLCMALLDQQEAITNNSTQIKDLQTQIATDNTQLITEQSTLTGLQGDMTTLQGQLDTANAVGDQTTIDSVNSQISSKQTQIDSQQKVVDDLQTKIDNENTQLNTLIDQVSLSGVSQELMDELSLFIIESVWRDDNYIDPNDLYTDGMKQFDSIRQPKIVIDVTIDNLFNIIEEQYYWDKINLADLIKVKYKQMSIDYMAQIIQVDYDFSNDSIALTIANTQDLLSDTDKLVQLLYTSSNASTTIQNNKYKWDKVMQVQDQVDSMISSAWDATKTEITAGVNESVVIGNRGIIITNPDLPDDVVIMQAGVIALSQDGGQTWKTAIKPDGIIAEHLIGQVVAGQNLLITNNKGSFSLDDNGANFDVGAFSVSATNADGSTTNAVDQWQSSSQWVGSFTDDSMITPYEKQQLNGEWARIDSEYQSLIDVINNYYTPDEQTNTQWIVDFKNNESILFNYLFNDKQSDGFALLDATNIGMTTQVDTTTYNNAFDNYYASRDEANKELSLKSMDVAQTAQNNVNEVMDDVVWKIELTSSNGLAFKNSIINTTITAKVYKGKDDVTSTLDASDFIWHKFDKNGVEDTAWGTAHTNVGNVITVTETDVQEKATFECDVNIP